LTWLIQEIQRQPDRWGVGRARLSRQLLPGLAIAGAIAVAAYLIEAGEVALIEHKLLDSLVIAMVMGVVLANTMGVSEAVRPGATFASKTVLEFAVVLLGASINIDQVMEGGARLILAVTLGVGFGMAISFAIGRSLGLHTRLSYLVAVGNSICGNSAIAAVAPVINAERREIASAIGLTAVAGVLVVLLAPLILPEAGLNHYQYGVIVGMAVYAVPQVVAAAFAVSSQSAEVATLVKLMRVMFLGPVVIGTGIVMNLRKQGHTSIRSSQLLPWFVMGFFLLVALRSSGAIPGGAIDPLRQSGKALTVWAMAGLGLGVEFTALRGVGPRGITSILSMLILVLASIGLVLVLDLNGASG
jgi:uncharacterized integral membrane protein (TIGR00698 family)